MALLLPFANFGNSENFNNSKYCKRNSSLGPAMAWGIFGVSKRNVSTAEMMVVKRRPVTFY